MRDPLGIGHLLYGLPQQAGPGVLMAAGAHWMTLIPNTHGDCLISTFCKNPLHPGPCKGWKKSLGKNAPGALNAIEKAHKEKVAAKRVARNEAKSAASKALTGRQLSSPLHAKKATIKAANKILGDDEAKAAKKADRVILNKQEIKKYSKIKAAQMNAVFAKHGMPEDTGLEDRIADALAKDNTAGKDDNYRSVIAVSGDSLGAHLANKKCKKGDGDCDGKPYEELRDELSGAAGVALATGDDEQLDDLLQDYEAGNFKPAEVATAKKVAAEMEEAKAAKAAEEQAAAEAKAAKAAKAAAKKKAAEPKTGTAAQAEKGKDFGLGLVALAKGNKTLGTKAAQADFEAKIKKALDEGDDKGVIPAGAEAIASVMVTQATNDNMAQPSLGLSSAEKTKFKELLQAEIEDGLKGGDAPKPIVETFKKAIRAKYDKDWPASAEAKAEMDAHIKAAAAAKLGLDPNLSTNAIAAHILFDPSKNMADGQFKARLQVAKGLTKDEYDALPEGHRNALAEWLDGYAQNADEKGDSQGVADAQEAQANLGLPKYGASADPVADAGVDIWFPEGQSVQPSPFDGERFAALEALDPEGFEALPLWQKSAVALFLSSQDPDGPNAGKVASLQTKFGLGAEEEPDVLQDLLDGVPTAPTPKEVFGPGGTGTPLDKVVSVVQGMTKEDWNGLTDSEKESAMDKVADALGWGYHGAGAAMTKLSDWQLADTSPVVPDPSLVPPTPPHLKSAIDYASGAKSGTATKKVEAYEQLTAEEFGALSTDQQQAITADLKAAQDKFIAPSKKAAVQKLLDKFSPATGGGAGAGGPIGATNPAGKTDADKIHDGADWASKFVPLLDQVGMTKSAPKDQIYAASLAMLQQSDDNGTKDKVTDMMGGIWAQSALEKLNAMHTDPLGNAFLLPEDIEAMKPALAADIVKKFQGEDGPTPVLDAWTKAISLGALDDAEAFMEAAAPGGGAGGSDFGAPASPAQVKAKQDAVKSLWHILGGAPAGVDTDKLVADALATGSVDQFAQDHANGMASSVMASMSQVAGVSALPADLTDLTKILDVLEQEFEQAIKNDQWTLPSESLTGKLQDIASEVSQAGSMLAANNGWSADSSALKNFKKSLMQARLAELADQLPAVGYAPAAPSAPATPVKLSPTGSFLAPTGPSSPPVDIFKAATLVPDGTKVAGGDDGQGGTAYLVAHHDGDKAVLHLEEYDEGSDTYIDKGVVDGSDVASTAPEWNWSATLPAKEAVAKAEKAAAAAAPLSSGPVNTTVGTGTDIDGIPAAKQMEIFNDLKSLPSGKYLSDSKEQTYGNLLALAAAHGTPGNPLSVLQVLKSVDASFASKNNVTNTNKWEQEFVDWLKTPAGSAFAAANPTADANLVKKLSGLYDGPTTDLAELAKKVDLVPGPGKFDPGLTAADFPNPTTNKAAALRTKMLASSGGKFTADELAGLKVYTGSSYTAMNSWLRNEKDASLSDHYKTAIKRAQKAMRPLPENVLLHRGTGWAQLPVGFQSAAGAKKLIGKTIMDEAFLSTSVGGNAAFGGPLLLEIEAPKGTYAAYVDGKQDGSFISSHPGEREMLLAAGQSYRVISVEEKGGKTVMRVRVVDSV